MYGPQMKRVYFSSLSSAQTMYVLNVWQHDNDRGKGLRVEVICVVNLFK